MVGLFDRVGLKNNVGKAFRMVCRPFQVAGTQSEASYGIIMTRLRPLYRERQWGWIQCTECG